MFAYSKQHWKMSTRKLCNGKKESVDIEKKEQIENECMLFSAKLIRINWKMFNILSVRSLIFFLLSLSCSLVSFDCLLDRIVNITLFQKCALCTDAHMTNSRVATTFVAVPFCHCLFFMVAIRPNAFVGHCC